MANVALEMEHFDVCGPIHLEHVDWREPNQRSSIAASLIQGVYVLEQDRQQNRVDHHALAPIWWRFFDLQLIEMLTDSADSSICGAIFEYQPGSTLNENDNIPSQSRPPKYVIAFRGMMIMEPNTRFQDLCIGMKVCLDMLPLDSRLKSSLKYVQNITAQVGPKNVWLAGHSLGAGIALLIGKTMARQGLLIDAFLFNPPITGDLSDLLSMPMLLTLPFVPFALELYIPVTAVLFVCLKCHAKITQWSKEFTKLCEWKPYLFVNKRDPICRRYISFYERQAASMNWRRLFDTLNPGNMDTLFGKNGYAPYLTPTAQLVKNVHPSTVSFKLAHGIGQWWARDLNLESITYRFDNR